MSSSSGLTRRRGGGGGAAAEGESSNGGIQRNNSSSNFDNTPETSYESNENGHKIAFDPRDISESTERSKQPKLTLMEEVLLLGLKDKQVRSVSALVGNAGASAETLANATGLPLRLRLPRC
jgi:Golgi phosphoprotein 3